MPYVAPSNNLELSNTISNLAIQASVGSSALTFTAVDRSYGTLTGGNFASVSFRDTTAADTDYTKILLTSPITLTISSGSTLGHSNGSAQYIYVYALNNAGTIELAASSSVFDDGVLASTTAEGAGGGADSSRLLYSTTARSNVAIRLIARFRSTQTTAGTWAAVPTVASMQNFTTAPQTWATETSRIEWARITFSSGTPVVFASSSPWITSITDTGTGDVTLNFKDFAASPFVAVTAENTTSDRTAITVGGISASTLRVVISRSDTATLIDANFFVIAIGRSI